MAELHTIQFAAEQLIIGGNVTLANTISTLMEASKMNGFEYALDLANHIRKMANVAVRNVNNLFFILCQETY